MGKIFGRRRLGESSHLKVNIVCYEKIGNDQPIRQGDIFFPLPRPKISLDELETISEDAGSKAVKWMDVKDLDRILVTVELEKTWGIIATQDCDAARSPIISLFQIEPFEKVTKARPGDPKAWVSMLTQRICKNASWFYLMKDELLGIDERMAVNFHKVFQIRREDLKDNIELRKGRLAYVAYEHYREAIAQYFRRYPYNEWYQFDEEELTAYAKNKKMQLCDINPKYYWNNK